jgi:hypothetical protein
MPAASSDLEGTVTFSSQRRALLHPAWLPTMEVAFHVVSDDADDAVCVL